VQLFAAAGGEAADVCFYCPVFVGILVTIAAAIAAVIRGSVWLAALSVIVSAFVGFVVIGAAATWQPTDNPEEQWTQRQVYGLPWNWLPTAALAVGSLVWVNVRRSRRQTG
jgi:hypothetical protein